MESLDFMILKVHLAYWNNLEKAGLVRNGLFLDLCSTTNTQNKIQAGISTR